MTAAIAMIGFAPTYAAIGVAAPLIIVLARLLQGFATGGEFASATGFLIESAPAHRRGFYGSWQMVGQGVAVLIGALLGALITARRVGIGQCGWGAEDPRPAADARRYRNGAGGRWRPHRIGRFPGASHRRRDAEPCGALTGWPNAVDCGEYAEARRRPVRASRPWSKRPKGDFRVCEGLGEGTRLRSSGGWLECLLPLLTLRKPHYGSSFATPPFDPS